MAVYTNSISAYSEYANIAKQAVTGSPSDWGVAATTGHMKLRSGRITPAPALTKARPDQETTGNRDANSQVAVPGRRSGGLTIPTVWRADTGALLALAALGAETVAEDPASSVRYKHIYRCSETPPWLTIDAFMGSEVSNVKQFYRHIGCGINEVTWNFDANEDTGLLTADYTFMSRFHELLSQVSPGYTQPTYSNFLQIASWKPKILITLPGGSQAQDNYFTSFSLTFSNGIARQKSAVGEQDDQGQAYGTRTVTATLNRIIPKGDTEVYRNLANSTDTFDIVVDMLGFTATGTAAAPDNTDRLQFHIPKAEVNTFPAGDINESWRVETVTITAVRDETISGPVEITVWNNKSTAY